MSKRLLILSLILTAIGIELLDRKYRMALARLERGTEWTS